MEDRSTWMLKVLHVDVQTGAKSVNKYRNQMTGHHVFVPHADLSAKCLLVSAFLMLSACGSGNNEGDEKDADVPAIVALAPVIDVSEGDSSPLADSVDTQILQESAARNAARGITANMRGAQSLNASRASVLASVSSPSTELFQDASSLFSDTDSEQLFSDDAGLDMTLVGTSSMEVLDGLLDASSVEQTSRLVEVTLGLNDNGGAMVRRDGNTIRVDPDDAALCDAVQLHQDMATSEIDTCQQLVSNLTVEIDAVTEQRGEITYFYSNKPLLNVAYGPLSAAYTLNLGILHQMGQYADQLAGVAQDAVREVQGSVRLQARVASTIEGQEAGNARFEIVDAIRVNYMDGSSFSMAPSLLMSLIHDSAAGTASVEMALGSTQLRGPASDPASVSFAGFNARINMDDAAGLLDVRELGFVGGPLKLSSADFSANLTMQALSFALEKQSEELVLNSALNVLLDATASNPDFGNSSFRFSLAGPAGTRIDNSADSDSTVTVLSGGPVQLEYSIATGSGAETGFVTWGAGSCQRTSSVSQDESAIMSLVDC